MAEGFQTVWTPWKDHDELLQNRAWLYGSQVQEGHDMRRKACDQVNSPSRPNIRSHRWIMT